MLSFNTHGNLQTDSSKYTELAVPPSTKTKQRINVVNYRSPRTALRSRSPRHVPTPAAQSERFRLESNLGSTIARNGLIMQLALYMSLTIQRKRYHMYIVFSWLERDIRDINRGATPLRDYLSGERLP